MFSFLWHGCPTIKQIINQTAKMSCKTMFTQYNPANEVGGKTAFTGTVAVCPSVCVEKCFCTITQFPFEKQ